MFSRGWKAVRTMGAVCLMAALLVSLAAEGWTQEVRCKQAFQDHIKSLQKAYSRYERDAKLSREQREQLQLIKNQAVQRITPITQTLYERQRQVVRSLFNAQTNPEAARRLGEEIAGLKAQVTEIKVNALLQARTVLTPAQQEQFASFHEAQLNAFQAKHPMCIPYISPGPLD